MKFCIYRTFEVMVFEIVAALLLVYFIRYFITTLMMRRNMPPGPFPYPFIGNIPHLFCDPVNPYGKLADKYGDIFTLSFPSGQKNVVLSSATLVREARLVTRKISLENHQNPYIHAMRYLHPI